MSIKQDDAPNDSWEPCSSGALSRLAQRDGRRRSTNRSLRLAGMAAGVAVCGLILGSGLWLREPSAISPSGEPGIELNHGASSGRLSYSCRDTIELRDRFLLGSAPPEARIAAREHLSHCAHCRTAYRQRAQELKVEYTVTVLPHGPAFDFLIAGLGRR